MMKQVVKDKKTSSKSRIQKRGRTLSERERSDGTQDCPWSTSPNYECGGISSLLPYDHSSAIKSLISHNADSYKAPRRWSIRVDYKHVLPRMRFLSYFLVDFHYNGFKSDATIEVANLFLQLTQRDCWPLAAGRAFSCRVDYVRENRACASWTSPFSANSSILSSSDSLKDCFTSSCYCSFSM